MDDAKSFEAIKCLMTDMIGLMDEESDALVQGVRDPALFKNFAVKKEAFLFELHKFSFAHVEVPENEFRVLAMTLAEKSQRSAVLLEARMRAVSTLLATLEPAEAVVAGPFALYSVQA